MAVYNGWDLIPPEDDPGIHEFFGECCEKAEFDNPLRFDEPLFIERYLSSSYSLKKRRCRV